MGAHNKYNASIMLEVVVPIGCDYNTSVLSDMIKLVDMFHPWISFYTDGSPAKSIDWMSGVSMKEGEYIDRIYEVEIRPPFMLNREQIFAYERYGDNLAHDLATILPKETTLRVDSALQITPCFNGGYNPRTL